MLSSLKNDSSVFIDREAPIPLSVQLYERIKDSIARGELKTGQRLPAVRAVAFDLGVSRGTVVAAYNRLSGEGLLISRGQGGTIVADVNAKTLRAAPRRAKPRKVVDGLGSSVVPGTVPLPYQLGIPALDAFPRKLWARLASRVIRNVSPSDLAYPSPSGSTELRNAISGYLGVSRGIACSPEQIFVTPGYQASLDLIGKVIMPPGIRVWVEDPSYRSAIAILSSLGAETVPIAVDAEGMRVEDAIKQHEDAQIAVITPTHQNPLGASLSADRAELLLDWAAQGTRWIVEDDYDGEFSYKGTPQPALKSRDREDRILYCATFSKTLFPALRVGYVVVPKALVGEFDSAAQKFQNTVSALVQPMIAAFIAEGHLARHLAKMRRLYRHRRALTQEALISVFGKTIRFDMQTSGMHLLARFGIDDLTLAAESQRAGLAVQSLSENALAGDFGQGLLLGFTNTQSEAMAMAFAVRLKAVVDSVRNR